MKEKIHPLRSIRRAGVPLCCFETADPAQTIRGCVAALNGKSESIALMQWTFSRGLEGLNDLGRREANKLSPGGAIDTGNPSECLLKLSSFENVNDVLVPTMPADGIVFMHTASRIIGDPTVIQGIWLLRDICKAIHATLVLLAPSITLPEELKNDVVVVSEPLPDAKEIELIVDSICDDAGLPVPSGAVKERAVDTMLGISAFGAEQALALSLSEQGINLDSLWDQKRKMIEQTPGLNVWRGGESFDDLGGLSNLKEYLTSIVTSGRTPVRALLYIDEIEKSLAGSSGDTSGTSQDQLQQILTFMQDQGLPGIILVGPPGTGKSAIAKASGTVAGAPVIAFDMGAMKGSLVGESERKIRAALFVYQAVSQGKGLVIATCNKIASLPPELRRRFTLGTFFVDLPNADERRTIWKLWIDRYKIDTQSIPDAEAWTGAEIKACCDVAYRANISLVQAATYIVPVSKSAADQIDALRKMASGRFISANYPGVYQMPDPSRGLGGRKLESFGA